MVHSNKMDMAPENSAPAPESHGLGSTIITELIYSPINLFLTAVIVFLLYKLIKGRYEKSVAKVAVPELTKIRKDMTVGELKQYDGTQPDGRVLVAVNGWIFDATRGRHFYGPGGPYSAFGGKDASRGLATFSVTSSDKEYDDLSDLNSMEMDSVKEWEAQFREKYDLVGRLLKPGEEPTNYSDEEPEDGDAPSTPAPAVPAAPAAPAAAPAHSKKED